MYKLIAIDLDGTLLTDELHDYTKNNQGNSKSSRIRNGCHDCDGSHVSIGKIICTATWHKCTSDYVSRVQSLKTLMDNEVMYERLIPPDIAQKLVEIARDKKLHLQVYQDDILYGASENDKIIEYSKKSKVPYKIEPDLGKLAKQGFTKALFIEEPDLPCNLTG